MKLKICGAIIGCLAMVAASGAVARELSMKEKGIIEGVAKQQLKDPDSAKFYWQDYRGGSIYCAHVNSKNSYGGYAGKALLIAGVKTDNKGTIISADVMVHGSDTASMSAPICTEEGYQP
ncbi:TPA: hypothetical protein JD825_RS22840 [Citrobacter freundii]|nr:hypothetical protein [Citrobacter freundii]HAT2362588.1 hypothetical protein [Citrobacter freundii]HCD1220490.1 hypothetical protein [Citrobacter freundii]HCD1225826.1 hypothetical protein [Citrobacter freundii]HCD1247488.1 hypothetical protein [Citrobacter freundii]